MTHEQIASLQCGEYIANKYGVYQFRSHVKALDNDRVIIGAKVIRCYFSGCEDSHLCVELDSLSYSALRRSEKIAEVNNGK